jgi:argininosuccinate lyase
MSTPSAPKLWGGRFSGDTDPVMEKFNNSLKFDKIMWKEDLDGSIAFAEANAACGILTSEECETIVDGLMRVSKEWESGTFEIKASDEDIHTANERRLTELVGAVGGKLHTGRSRNDQVATDVRLWLRKRIKQDISLLGDILMTAIAQARTHVDVLQAGFTHLQPAQVVRYSHWLMSYMCPLVRDMERASDMYKRVNVSPLGSGALAGNPFNIDRSLLAEKLGFDEISYNSLDATSDRDMVAEYMMWASLCLVHISQFAEDVIILNFQKMLKMSDAYCTGSSLMPQKKNPDALELLRGKAGRIVGHSTGFLCTLKGLPRAYNKDLQEDKEPLFDTAQTVNDCFNILLGIISTMEPKADKLAQNLVPEMLATDIAEYLVRKGVPFRETHHVAGAAVKLAEDRNIPLSSLTVSDLQTLHAGFEEDVQNIWSYEASAESRKSVGGTAKHSVLQQIDRVEQKVQSLMS